MKKLFILDAVNYLFRAYYAIGPMTNESGQSTSALFGFIRSVHKLIKDFSPEYLVAVFDGPDNKKSRREVYADYKMHRKGAPEDLYPQFAWAHEFCEHSGIPILCVEGVEADDTMATVALWAEERGAEAFLCSSDKDLMQLVNDRIFVLQLHKDNLIIDAKKVEELYGVKPGQICDLLAIMGDSSDNIPGLPGFGPKTASALLQEFGTLDELLAHPERVKGEKKQEALRSDRETALLGRQLATLNVQVDIPREETFYRLKPPSAERLAELYRTMNFKSLLKELDLGDAKKTQYHLVDTPKELEALASRLLNAQEICIDTETSGEQPMQAQLAGIGFSLAPGIAYYAPCNGALGLEPVLQMLRRVLSQGHAAWIGHNLKVDWHVLQNYGIELAPISFDTLLASYLLSPHNRRHNLDDVVLDRLGMVKTPLETLIGKGKGQKSLLDVPIPQVADYCCEDADTTLRLKELFTKELQGRPLERLFEDIEMPLLPILAKMERRGIYLDVEPLGQVGAQISSEIEQLRAEIFREAGSEFNLNSPQQLSKVLYEEMKLPLPRRTKTETATGADVLEDLATNHPIACKIMNYRFLEKLRSTYVESLPRDVHPQTGRIHCTFNQSVAATGRLSCQDPNLQNIPFHSPEGLMIRRCFKPQEEGWSYLGADYSQIELRLLAHFSKDPALLQAFRNNEDIHAYTASQIFGVPLSDVSGAMRSQAKAVNFGILYGQGAYGLSRQTGLSIAEAARFIDTYFERYPAVSRYIEACKETARATGMAQTLLGRTRPIPEMSSKNPSIRGAAERLAVNTPLQGTAADLIKKAMIAIDRDIESRRLKGFMILQIHDELIFEVPDEEIPLFRQLVKEKLETALQLDVPLEVSISVGKNWAEC